MNNSLIKTLTALTVALSLGSISKATQITGGIDFGNLGQPGATVVDNGNSTSTLTFSNEEITGTSPAGTTFAPVTLGLNPTLSFADILLGGTYPGFTSGGLTSPTDNNGNLWSFTDDGDQYSFVASTFNVTPDASNPGAWIISGFGVFSATGYDDTAGTYHVEFSVDGSVNGFAATSTAVPDGGSTALLVGLGLVGLGVYATRRAQLVKA